jgi:hypothetical protein
MNGIPFLNWHRTHGRDPWNPQNFLTLIPLESR